jgi:spore coat protein CotH
MWPRNRFGPRRGESAEDAFVRLYAERYGEVVSEENADALVIELLDEPSARWIVVGLYPELAGGPDDILPRS